MTNEITRATGTFYSPKHFVDYAHTKISEYVSDKWRDDFVVWDNCCGLKALTKDYVFKKLYSSTLFAEDLDNSSQFNTNSTSFQYDFLNDVGLLSVDKIPQDLQDCLNNNENIIFFINPPYVKANSKNGRQANCVDSDDTRTEILKMMNSEKMGQCSTNLFAQFIYRILLFKEQYALTNVYIAMFTPTTFLTGQSY